MIPNCSLPMKINFYSAVFMAVVTEVSEHCIMLLWNIQINVLNTTISSLGLSSILLLFPWGQVNWVKAILCCQYFKNHHWQSLDMRTTLFQEIGSHWWVQRWLKRPIQSACLIAEKAQRFRSRSGSWWYRVIALSLCLAHLFVFLVRCLLEMVDALLFFMVPLGMI